MEEAERRFREIVSRADWVKLASIKPLVEENPSTPVRLGDDFPDADGATEEEETVEGDRVTAKFVAAAPRVVTLPNLFQHPDSHPYVLDLALLQKYGPEWMEWESETLELRIPQDFPTRSVSDLNMEKIHAVKVLHYVNTYWLDWDVFLPCTMAFNSLYPDFRVMQVPTVAQCAVSVDFANRVRADVAWSEEVKMYLSAVHRFDGILCPFDPLEFVAVDTDGLPIDCDAIRARWPEVRRTGVAPTEESVTAEQLRRMLVVQEVLKEDRLRLQAQLPLLLNE